MKTCGNCGQVFSDEMAICPACHAPYANRNPDGSPTGETGPRPELPRLALAAGICGITSWFLWIVSGAFAGLGFLRMLPAIVVPGALTTFAAVILGHVARRHAKQKQTTDRGNGWTIAALSLGYGSMSIVPFLLGAFYFLQVLQKSSANTAEASRDQTGAEALRSINVAERAYLKNYKVGFSPTLAALGNGGEATAGPSHAALISPELAAGKLQGYAFVYVPISETREGKPVVTHYRVTARPTEEAKSTVSFFTDDSGIIRQSTSGDATAASPAMP
jgi:hypothetical protein